MQKGSILEKVKAMQVRIQLLLRETQLTKMPISTASQLSKNLLFLILEIDHQIFSEVAKRKKIQMRQIFHISHETLWKQSFLDFSIKERN